MEAYKASKASNDCNNDERIKYFAMTYLIGKNEVRSKMAIRFLGLDVTFMWSWRMTINLPEPEAATDPLVVAEPPAPIA